MRERERKREREREREERERAKPQSVELDGKDDLEVKAAKIMKLDDLGEKSVLHFLVPLLKAFYL